ncbi:hypothetical protein KXD93_09520 [Mucilaginibacter sp. BJC16-A38]|uniref:hypothetical protein n=1 Tax=Mucilaginibacter phenanthrenivorans TaxID=1234842 RepID=UPI00215787A5|nr:hypothetical protein [Mucilaginibacter phenanthrenivorans]MCR8557880.1 hypothetical protein [Mucilaginibacter phenanthrenivorans]
MKKFVFLFAVLVIIGSSGRAAGAVALTNSKVTVQQQVQHQTHKVKRRIRHRRHVSARRSKRMRMQLRQADKHLKDNKKAEAAQRKLKKE